MSIDIERLHELVHRNAIVELTEGKYGKSAVLCEPKESDSQVRIDGIPEDAIAFSLDDCFPAPNLVFANSRHECSRSDFVLVSDDGEGKNVVCIELKKKNDEVSHIKDQLRGSTAFVGYCREILNQFWHHEFPTDRYEFHYVAFLNTTKKRGTRSNCRGEAPNTDVDHFLKLNGHLSFQFNRIIQKKH